MAHNPVNHPLRPLYRALGAVVGVYFIAFGIVGLILTADEGLFGRAGDRVLGQGSNLFWSIVALLIGLIVLVSPKVGDAAMPRDEVGQPLTPKTHTRCPACREVVRKDASKCKHCASTLVPTL